MRNLNTNVLSEDDNISSVGEAINANQLVSASFHVYFGDALAAGTVKLQASNDVPNDRAVVAISGFQPTNWVDIPNQSTSVASGASKLLTVVNMAYQWIRVVYDNTTFFSSKVIQDLTYTAKAAGVGGSEITIEYVGDGTAGAETVDVTGSAIVVHMDPTAVTGSTADDILAAIEADAEADALVSVAVSGTGSDVQAVQAETALDDAAGSSSINVNMNALSL
jgi:hypothetical protein